MLIWEINNMGVCADKWLKQKGSDYRNTTALILNCWRKNHSIAKTHRMLKMSEPTIRSHLKKSKCYIIIASKHNLLRLSKKDIEIQMQTKNSPLRRRVCFMLKIYRKTKKIKDVAHEIGEDRKKVVQTLTLSRFYVGNKNNISKQLKQKHSIKRKEISIVLNDWRKTHSVCITSKNLNMSVNRILRRIKHSKRYQNSKYRRRNNKPNFSENEMKTKNSEYRNKLALILKTWKNFHAMKQTAKYLSIKEGVVVKMLSEVSH